jgi:hypothetical protein
MQSSTTGHGAGSVKNESAYGGIKTVTVLSHEKVAAVHGAAGCAKSAAAGVLKGFAGTQQGLLTDHAQPFDFLAVTALVLNHPMAGNQLHRHPARVGDRDGVGESENILQRVTLLGHVLGQHVNLNGVGGHARMLTATIQG